MTYDFNNPCGLDATECEHLSTFCKNWEVKSAIEFGPGNSTIAMLNGGVQLIHTFEQDEERVHRMAIKFPNNVNVHWYYGKALPLVPLVEIPHVDLAFIDGPCGDTITPARINAALFCFRRARFIGFHDAKRDIGTISIVKDLGMWTRSWFPTERGMEILEHARA